MTSDNKNRFGQKPNLPGDATPPATGGQAASPPGAGSAGIRDRIGTGVTGIPTQTSSKVTPAPAAQAPPQSSANRFGAAPIPQPLNLPPTPIPAPVPSRRSFRVTTAQAMAVATLVFCVAAAGAIYKLKQGGFIFGTLSPTQIADKAKPATVLVVASFDTTITGPNFGVIQSKLDELKEATQNDPDAEKKRFAAILNNPEEYLAPAATTRTSPASIVSTGSGFIASADGIVVTNAHVVKPDKNDFKEQLVKMSTDWAASDLQEIESDVERTWPGQVLNDEAKDRLSKVLLKIVASSISVGDITKKVMVLRYHSTGDDTSKQKVWECSEVAIGEPTPGKDVAVLKMQGKNLPFLPLAPNLSTGNLKTGNSLHIFGFPGVATFSQNFAPTSITEPSMTGGIVSAIKETKDKWNVIQTDAAAAEGNSGGPVLDDEGRVVGIMTYACKDPQTGETVPGFNFVMPVDIIREFVPASVSH